MTLALPIILICLAAVLIIWLARYEEDHLEDAPPQDEWTWPGR